MILNSPFYGGIPQGDIAKAKDVELEKKFKAEYKNGTKDYERAFLLQILNTNVDIYKANSTLTDWGKLKLNQTTNVVENIPCN
ncbi:hypothetical protein [Flavobacterium sp. U410]